MKVPLPLAALPLLAALTPLSCEREARRFQEPEGSNRPLGAAITAPPRDVGPPRWEPPYGENAWAVTEGKRLFGWFNCAGCHGLGGGGGMGPPLADDRWRYGIDPEDVFASIVDGRPNGMPAFRGKIPDQQIWELVAYVRSMSGHVRMDAAPGRSDRIESGPPEIMRSETTPRREEVKP
jgi:cytochrome c oxidase cbb3-type subunit 3